MEFKRCSDVSMELIYKAFSIGFSDYIIKIQIDKESFVNRFFGPEGNSLSSSFIALDGDRPIGVVLGGIKEYEGIRTIRCGTLCIDPEYRGRGVSQRLMELHKNDGIENGCRQLFLEVIVGNDRAINFYKKLGYEKVYDLKYFSLEDIKILDIKDNPSVEIREINIQEMRKLQNKICDIHINWQNDFDYMEKSSSQHYFGAYINDNLIGAVGINKSSKLSFIWVDFEERNKGIGTILLKGSAESLGLSKIAASSPNNASLEGFIRKIGFKKDKIEQYEMYYTL